MVPKIHVNKEKYEGIKKNLAEARKMAKAQMDRAKRDIAELTRQKNGNSTKQE